MTSSRIRDQVSLAPLEQAVLETIAYSDVFDFAVTLDEIWKVLPVAASRDEVAVLLSPVGGLDSSVEQRDGLFFLKGRDELVDVRRRREAASAKLMKTARWYGSLIARFPFVRMVAITGSLAVDSAEPEDDIDYLIVTTPGRLWLSRALIVALVRVAALRGVTVCPNYLITESAMELPERDWYTARELLQMRPLAGRDAYARMLALNSWCRDFLPNWTSTTLDVRPLPSRPFRIVELALGGRFGAILERFVQSRKLRRFQDAAAGNAETEFSPDVCKGHFDSHRARLGRELTRRLAGREEKA